MNGTTALEDSSKSQGDYWKNISDSFQDQLGAKSINLSGYCSDLDVKLSELGRKLKKEAQERARRVVLTLISAPLGAFAILAYTETRVLIKGSSDICSVVIDLQSKVRGAWVDLGGKQSRAQQKT